jgi:hypothetical protein
VAVTDQLNSLVVKTEIDEVFNQEFNFINKQPGFASVSTPEIFKQMTIDNAAHIEAVLSGAGGYWNEKGEEQDTQLASPRVTNKTTYTAVTFAKGIQLSKEFWDDNMHGTWSKMVSDFARNGRITREREGFGLYRNSFTTTLTADGSAFISTSHTLIDGGTQSNEVTSNPPLSPDALNSAMTILMEMKSQDGVIAGCVGSDLLVPPKLFKKATEIVESALLADTANNNMNVYSSTYGIRVWTSNQLGAAAGGSDTAWWLLSSNHAVTRYIREDINTVLVDWKFTSNNNYIYKAVYREVYGVVDYVGAVGSDGTGV